MGTPYRGPKSLPSLPCLEAFLGVIVAGIVAGGFLEWWILGHEMGGVFGGGFWGCRLVFFGGKIEVRINGSLEGDMLGNLRVVSSVGSGGCILGWGVGGYEHFVVDRLTVEGRTVVMYSGMVSRRYLDDWKVMTHEGSLECCS